MVGGDLTVELEAEADPVLAIGIWVTVLEAAPMTFVESAEGAVVEVNKGSTTRWKGIMAEIDRIWVSVAKTEAALKVVSDTLEEPKTGVRETEAEPSTNAATIAVETVAVSSAITEEVESAVVE